MTTRIPLGSPIPPMTEKYAIISYKNIPQNKWFKNTWIMSKYLSSPCRVAEALEKHIYIFAETCPTFFANIFLFLPCCRTFSNNHIYDFVECRISEPLKIITYIRQNPCRAPYVFWSFMMLCLFYCLITNTTHPQLWSKVRGGHANRLRQLIPHVYVCGRGRERITQWMDAESVWRHWKPYGRFANHCERSTRREIFPWRTEGPVWPTPSCKWELLWTPYYRHGSPDTIQNNKYRTWHLGCETVQSRYTYVSFDKVLKEGQKGQRPLCS